MNNYVFAIDDATGTAGPSPDALGHVSGWGLVNVIVPPVTQVGLNGNGDFVWTATPADKLTVAIDTLVNPTTVGTDVAGLWRISIRAAPIPGPPTRWAGTYLGPTGAAMLDAATNFDTSGFENPIAGTFGWSLDPANQTLSLTYTPTAVPEPGTFTLCGFAAIGGMRYWRRRFCKVRV